MWARYEANDFKKVIRRGGALLFKNLQIFISGDFIPECQDKNKYVSPCSIRY